MRKKRESGGVGGKAIVILWLATAIALIAVMFVYYGRIASIHDELDQAAYLAKIEKQEKLEINSKEETNEEQTDLLEDKSVDDDKFDSIINEAIDDDEIEKSDIKEPEDSPYKDNNLNPEKKIIAITFDDGPSIYTERILKALADNNAKATFFMVGYNVEKSPERVKLVYEAGCEVANHTEDHKSLTEGTKEEILERIHKNEDRIKSIIPVERVLVRPPYGSYNETTREIVDRPMINWSVDSLDWKSRNADAVVKEIKANAKDGYVILMHDIYESTAEAVERILPWLIEEGYQVTSVSAMYEARGEELLAGHVYRNTSKKAKTDN